MQNVPYEDRAAFWKFQSAATCFQMAEGVCKHLLRDELKRDDTIYDPLVISLHTIYARPFKQRKVLRISEDLVPIEYKGIHDALIQLRDKMHVHTDLDGPITNEGVLLNELAGYSKNNNTIFGINILRPTEVWLNGTIQLSQALNKKASYHANKIWTRYMRKKSLPDKTWIVNLASGDAPFLIEHPHLQ